MGALKLQEADLREKLASLDNSRKARAAAISTDPDAALLAGADPLWHRWIDRRRSALNTALARVLVAQELAHTGLVRAFGRKAAAESLCDQHLTETRRAQERAAERPIPTAEPPYPGNQDSEGHQTS
jgi:hypothetical protein